MMTLNIEEIITVAVMSLWLLFPIGMFISVMRQQDDEVRPHYPKVTPLKKESVIHVTPIRSYIHEQDENDDGEDDKYGDYSKIPKKHPEIHERRT